MGVDWTALEEALRVSALRHAEHIIREHPAQDFYAIALHGVSTEESESIAMPLLALNSVQALNRDRAAEDREQYVERGEDADIDVVLDEVEDDESEETAEPEAAEDDVEDVDAVLNGFDSQLDGDSESFYSDKWEPSDWHWSSLELCEDVAAQLWSKALTDAAQHHGWSETIKAYYRSLVNVANALRRELATGDREDLVVYVADEEHAERLLQLCLTPEQLQRHFPELAASRVSS